MVFDHTNDKIQYTYGRVECPEPVACSTGLKATLNAVERVEGQHYFYILECADNSFYCGSSNNLLQRLNAHNKGKAAEWTKIRKPVQLVYFEVYDSFLTASRREFQVKGWVREKKENLITGKWKKQV
jgi:putative endonuclease